MSALFDDETTREAKYGENACTAQEMSYRAARKAARQGKQFMRDLTDDTDASGTQNVKAAPVGDDQTGGTAERKMAAARAEVKNLLGNKEGENHG